MSTVSRDLMISKEKMAEISEDELEDILKDLPAHEIYSELNENVQNEPKLARHCTKLWPFKNNYEEMKNLCKRIAWNLEKLSDIRSKNPNDVSCSYFNHWMYNEIWKLVLTEDNYEIDEDAILKLASIGYDINKELSRPCSYEYYNIHDFSEWKKMKNLHDYFKNFDQIKGRIHSPGDKYEKYNRYIKYISKIYDDYEDECCGPLVETPEFSPIYFKCHNDYHPKNLLALLESNQTTSGAQPLVKNLNELNTQGESSENFTLEIQNRSDLSDATKLNQLTNDEFQTTDQSSVITDGEGFQYSELPSIENSVYDTCQYVDSLDHNPRNMNCRFQEASKPSHQEESQEQIDQVSGSLQEATEKIHDEGKKREDIEGSVAGKVTSLTLQVDGHSGQRRSTYVHESGPSSRAVQKGHTLLPYKDSGNGYTDSSDISGEEHSSLEFFSSHFSSIMGILKKNLFSISIVSSASIGLIILLLVYFKIRRRKTGLRRKREQMNNNYYTYGEEEIPELLGYSQNFAYSNPDNRQIPIFYSYA